MIYFILGSHPELAIAEIQSVLGELDVVHQTTNILLINSDQQNISALQERLASVIKIGHIIGELPTWDDQQAADLIASYASGAMGKNKISFGISIYGSKDLQRETDALGGGVKKRLKDTGRPVRYVTSKEPTLSSAVIETNNLLSSGGEFVLLEAPGTMYLGQTQTIQDFKAWSDRDYGRPARDKRSGMLPPKLARTMINLSGAHPEQSAMLDPFCGSGTVLMEASLMGFKKLIGSDISEKAIEDTTKNLTWLASRFELEPPKLFLFTTPAAELPEHLSDAADAIVAEVFLGTPRHAKADKRELQNIEKRMMPMFEESFANLKPLLAPGAKAVIAFPSFRNKKGGWHKLPIQNMLTKLGYTVEAEYLYFRSNQFIARNIFIFKHL